MSSASSARPASDPCDDLAYPCGDRQRGGGKSGPQCIIRARRTIPRATATAPVPMPDPMTESAAPLLPCGSATNGTHWRICCGEPDVLAVIGFGAAAATLDDPRLLQVGLEPLQPASFEVWRSEAPVRSGRAGDLRWSEDGEYLFFAIEVDEDAMAASPPRPNTPIAA